MTLRPIKALVVMEPVHRPLVYSESVLDRLSESVFLVHPAVDSGEQAMQLDCLDQVDVILSGWGGPVLDAAFLQKAPRLLALFHGAGTLKKHVTEATWERGILLTTAAAANAVPVAEFVVAMVTLALKDVYRNREALRSAGEWKPAFPLAGTFGSRVGIVGFGLIGRMVAERLRQSYDLEFWVYDPYVSAAEIKAAGARKAELLEIFAQCRGVSIHLPSLPETAGMIDEACLSLLQENAFFINTARGAVVDEHALTRIAGERKDLCFYLDVTDPEPPAVDSILFRLDNVFVTPHVAGSMGGECGRMGAMAVEECNRFSRGEAPLHSVDKFKFSSMA